jgi:hypothetical protein
MKSILYAGAALMVAAGIYGIVEAKQNSSKKEFKAMYEEKKVAEPEETIVEEKIAVVGKEEIKPAAPTNTKKMGANNTITKKKKAVTKKKKRSFNTKLFSRGGLDERFIEGKKLEPIKADSKITEEIKL